MNKEKNKDVNEINLGERFNYFHTKILINNQTEAMNQTDLEGQDGEQSIICNVKQILITALNYGKCREHCI